MAVVHSTGQFAEELWPGIQEHWGQEYDEFPAIYSRFMTMENSDKAFEKVQQITGFPRAGIKEEGQEAVFSQMFQGFQKEYRNLTYSIGAIVTREMVEDEQYGTIKKIPKLLARSMRETEEVVSHTIINEGFNSVFGGPDGVELFSNAHPVVGGGANQSNILAVAADLSQTSLENATTQIMRFQDDQGLQIKVRSMKLFVPSESYHIAHKLIGSDYIVGSADNDINTLKSDMTFEVITSPYLTDTDAWFIVTDVEGIRFFERRGAELDRDNDFETDNLKMKTTQRFAVGFDDWRAAFGTPGA